MVDFRFNVRNPKSNRRSPIQSQTLTAQLYANPPPQASEPPNPPDSHTVSVRTIPGFLVRNDPNTDQPTTNAREPGRADRRQSRTTPSNALYWGGTTIE